MTATTGSDEIERREPGRIAGRRDSGARTSSDVAAAEVANRADRAAPGEASVGEGERPDEQIAAAPQRRSTRLRVHLCPIRPTPPVRPNEPLSHCSAHHAPPRHPRSAGTHGRRRAAHAGLRGRARRARRPASRRRARRRRQGTAEAVHARDVREAARQSSDRRLRDREHRGI